MVSLQQPVTADFARAERIRHCPQICSSLSSRSPGPFKMAIIVSFKRLTATSGAPFREEVCNSNGRCRQIAANRRNARKKHGPRSGAGKKRTSRNSYRHGLTATRASNAVRAKRIEKLARKIIGDAKGVIKIECAPDRRARRI